MPEPEKRKKEEEVDIFRDTPLRYLGYANEIGESFRSIVEKKWVWLSYGVASTYVLADTESKAQKMWCATRGKDNQVSKTASVAADTLLWQSLASVIIPGFVINRICYATRKIVKKTKFKSNAKWASVFVGLASIPLIIHPIDYAVDFGLDHTLRKWLELPLKHKREE